MARSPDTVTTDDEALAAMTAAGYTNIANMVHHGHIWKADATDTVGAAVVIVCHGKDGRVNVDDESDDLI